MVGKNETNMNGLKLVIRESFPQWTAVTVTQVIA